MRLITRAMVLLLSAVGLALVGSTAVAEAATSSSVSAQDATFLRAAHQANLAEITVGKQAESKGNSASVRNQGRMWVSDHTKLDASLKQQAKKLGVALPSTPNATQQALATRLSKLSGSAYDTAWLSGGLTGHVATRTAGRTELARGSNATALQIDRTSAPIVQHHINELVAAQRAHVA